MPLTQDTIAGFIGGVSQQPDKLMFPNQVKKLINMSPDPVQGLCKRKPTEHIKKLMNVLSVHPYVHTINKEDEQYKVYLTGTEIKVFDLEGNEKTVHYGDPVYEVVHGTTKCYTKTKGNSGATVSNSATLYSDYHLTTKYTLASGENKSDFTYNGVDEPAEIKAELLPYITTQTPLKTLSASTIADYTFITNKTVVAALENTTFPNPYPNAALIFVKQGNYGIDYIVKVNGSTVASKTTSISSVTDLRTNLIADDLYNDIVTNLGTTNWNISRLNSTIMLSKKNGSTFTIQTVDSNADRNLFSFYKETKDITELPVVAPNGFILKIIGEKADSSDDYYVQFETADGSSFGTGTWKECCSPECKYKVKASTMPHVLIRESNGTFTFKRAEWTNRRAGDETTAKTPSVFGNTIEEVFTHKGRLGFVTGDKTLYSDVDDIFSLFKRTVMTSLDTDPIDVGSNSKMVLLKHSLAFNEDLLLFSPTSIFTITSGDVFSNATVGVDLTMEYPCSSVCKPIGIGGSALFAHDNGSYSGVYEIYVASTYKMAARSITEQIPCYIPKGVYKMTANVENNTVCLLNTTEKNKIFVYNYYYSSEAKAQSAWHVWKFEGDVLGAEFVNNYLYLTIQYEDGVYLERIDITPVQHEEDLDFLVYLDRKVYFDNIEDDEIIIPYVTDGNFQIINEKGFPVTFTFDSNTNKATLTSEYESVIVGIPFDSRVQLATIYQRSEGEAGVKTAEGLLMLKDINLNYLNTGYFRVITSSHFTTIGSSVYTFTGVILGTVSATLGKIPVSDGSFLIPVMSKNEDIDIEIINDSYLPATFTSVVWLGDFNVRGK